jgi:hypothetical protein
LIGYLNSNVVFSDGRFSAPGLRLQPAYMEMLGVEWRIRRHLSAHLQYEYYTSPFRGSGLNLLDHGVSEFSFGISHATQSHLLIQLYGIENLNVPFGAAADFTFGLAISWFTG